MKKMLWLLVLTPLFARADIVSCESEVWSPEACAPMIAAFKSDPYAYLSQSVKTISAARVAIISGANRGLVATWNDKFWDVISRDSELGGFIDSEKSDPRTVRVRDPNSSNIETTSAFGGCYFLRDLVLSEDSKTCDEFLEPTAREFYLAASAFKSLCGRSEDALHCEALAPFYK